MLSAARKPQELINAERAVIEEARDVAGKLYITDDFMDAVEALEAEERKG